MKSHQTTKLKMCKKTSLQKVRKDIVPLHDKFEHMPYKICISTFNIGKALGNQLPEVSMPENPQQS